MKVDSEDTSTKELHFPDNHALRMLIGEHDKGIKQIEKLEDVTITVHGNKVLVKGDDVGSSITENLLLQLYSIIKKGYPVYPTDIDYAHRMLSRNSAVDLEKIFLDTVFISSKKRTITPKSIAQKLYIDSIRAHDMVFGIGPCRYGENIPGNGPGCCSADGQTGPSYRFDSTGP